MKTVITFGTYDLFHIGHLNLLRRACALGDRLVVGVSTDLLNYAKKGILPVFSFQERMQIIQSLECVDTVFSEESLELKRYYIHEYKADILVMGDDWQGKFDHYQSMCKVIYLPRTKGISTTLLKTEIKAMANPISHIAAGSQNPFHLNTQISRDLS